MLMLMSMFMGKKFVAVLDLGLGWVGLGWLLAGLD
jgi:hypothetical protein